MGGEYSDDQPKRAEIDALAGPTVLDFGNNWCGHCRRAQPLIAAAMAGHPGVRHIKVADASSRRLGRSFRVKFWPTLVFLEDGKETARLVRPADSAVVGTALAQIDPSG